MHALGRPGQALPGRTGQPVVLPGWPRSGRDHRRGGRPDAAAGCVPDVRPVHEPARRGIGLNGGRALAPSRRTGVLRRIGIRSSGFRAQDRPGGTPAPGGARPPDHHPAHRRLPRHQLRGHLRPGHRRQPGGVGRSGASFHRSAPRRHRGGEHHYGRQRGPGGRRHHRAGARGGGSVPAGRWLFGRTAAAMRSARRAADFGRGHLRVRPPRAVVRGSALRRDARPDYVRQGGHLRLPARGRSDLQPSGVRCAGAARVDSAHRLHLLRPPCRYGCRSGQPGPDREGAVVAARTAPGRQAHRGPRRPSGRRNHPELPGGRGGVRRRVGLRRRGRPDAAAGSRGCAAARRHRAGHLSAAGHHRPRDRHPVRHHGRRAVQREQG